MDDDVSYPSPSGSAPGLAAQRRVERAVFETDRHRLVGDVTLPQAGYQRRFSDLLNRTEFEFIPLTNVEITFHGDGSSISRDFVALNKRHVRLCYEVDEIDE
jgi:hypothetical protein